MIDVILILLLQELGSMLCSCAVFLGLRKQQYQIISNEANEIIKNSESASAQALCKFYFFRSGLLLYNKIEVHSD